MNWQRKAYQILKAFNDVTFQENDEFLGGFVVAGVGKMAKMLIKEKPFEQQLFYSEIEKQIIY